MNRARIRATFRSFGSFQRTSRGHPNDERRTRHYQPVHSAGWRRDALRRLCWRIGTREPASPSSGRSRRGRATSGRLRRSIQRRVTASPNSLSCRSTRWRRRRTGSSGWSGSCSRQGKPCNRLNKPARSRAAADFLADCSVAAAGRRPPHPKAIRDGADKAAPVIPERSRNNPITSRPPPPQYPPNYQQGMFQQRGGSGFLGSALTTAAGVAGGVVAGNALMSLFSSNRGEGGFGGGVPGGEPVGDASGTHPGRTLIPATGTRAAERLRPGTRIMSITAPGTSQPPTAIRRGTTTVAAAGTAGEATATVVVGTAGAAVAIRTTRSSSPTGMARYLGRAVRTGIVCGVG